MRLSPLPVVFAAALSLTALPASAKHHHHHYDGTVPGLANVTLLVVRHAEKPADAGDPGLSPAGQARAKAYATYFHTSPGGRRARSQSTR